MNLRILLVILIVFAETSSGIAEIHVEADSLSGTGYFMPSSGICYVIAPYHIIKSSPLIKLISSSGIEINAYSSDLSLSADDIGILKMDIKDKLSKKHFEEICISSRNWNSGSHIESALKNIRSSELSMIESDGTTTEIPVRIESSSQKEIIVKAEDQSFDLKEGTSGALLIINGQNSGMFRAVNDEEGIVIRQDYIFKMTKKVAVYLISQETIENLKSMIELCLDHISHPHCNNLEKYFADFSSVYKEDTCSVLRINSLFKKESNCKNLMWNISMIEFRASGVEIECVPNFAKQSCKSARQSYFRFLKKNKLFGVEK